MKDVKEKLLSTRLAALFLFGCLGFNAPLLRLVARDVRVAGLPLTWIYLFGFWTVLIGLLAMLVRPPRGE
ncbi:MAG TPA: hypothetical protein VJ725_07750 [Thermoanaerobaculia bacterium]|nr:hypothetical protein [Thermoanaerobaculia bacterium]